jgi:hypothetical protein
VDTKNHGTILMIDDAADKHFDCSKSRTIVTLKQPLEFISLVGLHDRITSLLLTVTTPH